MSYQKYSRLSGVGVKEIEDNDSLNDGYVMMNLRPGIKLIVYNRDSLLWRKRFTVFHEIGHVMLGHKKHGKQEDCEANFFSSQIMAPDCVLQHIKNKGHTLRSQMLTSCFGLSESSAWNKMESFGTHPFIDPVLDSQILTQFHAYLAYNIPWKLDHSHMDLYKDD